MPRKTDDPSNLTFLVCTGCVFFSMPLPPPRSPLFPTRRSSDLTLSCPELIQNCSSPGSMSTSAVRRAQASRDRKSTRLNSSHLGISYAVFCLKKKKRLHRPSSPHPCDLHGPTR